MTLAHLRHTIAFHKRASSHDDWWARRIPLTGVRIDGALTAHQHWSLLPVCELHRDDPLTIDLLGTWRAAAAHAYPTRFPVTADGTRRWLSEALLDNPDRHLFVICDALGRPVGHVGVALTDATPIVVEVDNLLRGEVVRGVHGLMTAATTAVMRWVSRESAATSIEARVLASNGPSLRHVMSLGFVIVDEQPLVATVEGERTSLVPASPDDVIDDAFVTLRANLDDVELEPEWIPTAGPSIGAHELVAVTSATSDGWQAHHSDALREFEQRFADYVGADRAIATSSCTAALHLALLALGIGPGDEVIVPDLTWVASAAAVAYTGATPVFADVDDDTWVLTADTVRPLITERTRAIMPVHLYGFAAPLLALRDLADEYGLWLIEDAAPAIGTRIGESHVGTIGHIGCFSFQGAKMLVTGEGGMVVTNDPGLADAVTHINDHGRTPGTFRIERLGRKYKMNNISAALGLGQLARVDVQVAHKRRLHEWYREELVNVPGLRMQQPAPGTWSNCWMTSVRLDPATGVTPTALAAALANDGIDTRPVFTSLREMPLWPGGPAPLPNAGRIGSESLNLPSGVLLPLSAVRRVADCVRRALG